VHCSPIVELRQYTLLPGKRDVLIDLFEANFVESQEETGIDVIGTFRDLDDKTSFVWLRGFQTMVQRAQSLADFYGGEVWREHRERANATMVDVDNVLLLRPARPGSEFVLADEPAPPTAGRDRGIVSATIVNLAAPAGSETLVHFEHGVAPLIVSVGGTLLGCFVTEPSENTFPALPVREGENVFVYFVGFPDRAGYAAAEPALAEIVSAATDTPGVVGAPQLLRLEPTPRSRLSGTTADHLVSLTHSNHGGRADD
jgi:hypothetical protein